MLSVGRKALAAAAIETMIERCVAAVAEQPATSRPLGSGAVSADLTEDNVPTLAGYTMPKVYVLSY